MASLSMTQTQQQPSYLLRSILRLHKLLLADRGDLGAVFMFAFLAGLVQLSLPLGIQAIISFVLAGSISTSIIVLISMVVIGVFLNGLLQVRQLQVIEKIRQKIFSRYSLGFSEHLPRINIERLDREYLPELVNRYFDSITLQKGIDKLLVELPAALIQVVLGLLLLAFYHPVFIAFGLTLLVIVFMILRFTSPQGLQTALQASTYKYAVAGWLQEVARTIKTFKYTKGTSLHLQKTDELVGEYLETRTSHFKILLTQFWSLISFKIIITAAMLIIGSILLVNQEINVGQFIAADIVILAIIASIEKLIINLDTIYDALVSVEKLNVVIEAETETSGKMPLAPIDKGLRINFSNVNYAYSSGHPILQDLHFQVEPGQIVQLKGPSGSGKSTILRLLTGAFTNYSGKILLDDLPLANYSTDSLRLHTGILLSNQDIFYGTIRENLTMGSESISQEEITVMTRITGLEEFIQSNKEGYDRVLLPGGNKLSRQVRKNILLIRALLGKHRLLLLEEPFEHLSPAVVMNLLTHIRSTQQVTILIASAGDEMASIVDKIIHLPGGETSTPINHSNS